MTKTASDQGESEMGRVTLEFTVSNYRDVVKSQEGTLALEKVRHFQLEGVVDTGATGLVLPTDVADRLGLSPVGEVTIHYGDRRSARRPLVDDARVDLLGRQGTFQAVSEPDRTTALIGAVVLETLDFLVDPLNQRLVPRDPAGITAEVE
ncbi:MAG TPA: aspartyl protease family protein [Gemmataceae bacterium]|nr:aspartyl protease family protein [Gemmataceae bacterium]